MPKPYQKSVKCLSGEAGEREYPARLRDAPRAAPAIDRITDDGVADGSHVHADLVRAAGRRPTFDETRDGTISLQRPVLGHG